MIRATTAFLSVLVTVIIAVLVEVTHTVTGERVMVGVTEWTGALTVGVTVTRIDAVSVGVMVTLLATSVGVIRTGVALIVEVTVIR